MVGGGSDPVPSFVVEINHRRKVFRKRIEREAMKDWLCDGARKRIFTNLNPSGEEKGQERREEGELARRGMMERHRPKERGESESGHKKCEQASQNGTRSKVLTSFAGG